MERLSGNGGRDCFFIVESLFYTSVYCIYDTIYLYAIPLFNFSLLLHKIISLHLLCFTFYIGIFLRFLIALTLHFTILTTVIVVAIIFKVFRVDKNYFIVTFRYSLLRKSGQLEER